MKKNGFVFVESIIAVVILASSLLLLYSSFTTILQTEKTRVYYDDASYIYRTWYLKELFNNLNFTAVIRDLTANENKDFVTVGAEYQGLFEGHEQDRSLVNKLLSDYEVNQIIVMKESKVDDLKKCTQECANNRSCSNYESCNNLYMNVSESMLGYLKTINIDLSCTYVFVAEYTTCNAGNTNCHKYYSWVSV